MIAMNLGLTDDDLGFLGIAAGPLFFRRRSPIYLAHDRVYQLLSGRVKMSHVSTEGREVILDLVEPGELFGEMHILDASEDVTAEALEDSRVVAIPRPRLEGLLLDRPGLALRLARLVAVRRQRTELRLRTLAYSPVPQRLGNLLLQLCRQYGAPHHRGTLLRIRLSQGEFGSLIGACREIVNSTLSEFRQKGLVDVSRTRIIVRERELREELTCRRSGVVPFASSLERRVSDSLASARG